MRRPTAPTLIALGALFVALGGPAQAARLIDGGDIRAGSVTARQVKNRSLGQGELSRRAVRVLKETPDASITADKLGDDSVRTRALAPASVMTGTVADDSLTAADLAFNSVGVDELAADAAGQGEIRNNGVGRAEIADQSVGGGEVVDGGLRARDIARFAGTLTVDFSSLAGGDCQAAIVSGTPADLADADISGDMILLAPVLADPIRLTFGTARASGAGQFRIYACNPTGAAINAPELTFRYVIVGFG